MGSLDIGVRGGVGEAVVESVDVVAIGDVVILEHALEDLLLSLGGEFGIGSKWRVVGRGSWEACKESRLGEIQISCRFGKIGTGGGFDAVGGAAVRYGVEIFFQDLVFGENFF